MTLTIGALRVRMKRREQPGRIEQPLIAPARTLDERPSQVATGRIDGKIAIRTGNDGEAVTMGQPFAIELIANLQHLVDEDS